MSIAMPKKPKRWNAYLTASGYGTIYCRITTIDHGMVIIARPVATKRTQTAYIVPRTPGSFTVEFTCVGYAEYKAFGRWMQGYGNKLSIAGSKVGPVRVVCPSRKFDKVVVPSGAPFGIQVGQAVYRFSVNFDGSNDPVKIKGLSKFVLPKGSPDKSLPYYYPGGTQLKGSESGVDSMFDVPAAILGAIGGGVGGGVVPPNHVGGGGQVK